MVNLEAVVIHVNILQVEYPRQDGARGEAAPPAPQQARLHRPLYQDPVTLLTTTVLSGPLFLTPGNHTLADNLLKKS